MSSCGIYIYIFLDLHIQVRYKAGNHNKRLAVIYRSSDFRGEQRPLREEACGTVQGKESSTERERGRERERERVERTVIHLKVYAV